MRFCVTVPNLITFNVKGVIHRLSSEGSFTIVHVGFVVDTMSLGYVSYPLSVIISSISYSHQSPQAASIGLRTPYQSIITATNVKLGYRVEILFNCSGTVDMTSDSTTLAAGKDISRYVCCIPVVFAECQADLTLVQVRDQLCFSCLGVRGKQLGSMGDSRGIHDPHNRNT
jgi:hypothetical protein